jgi:YcxB-like protein
MGITVEFDLAPAEIAGLLRARSRNPLRRLTARGPAGTMDRMIARMSGPTKAELTEEGIRTVTNDDERRIAWSQLRAVNERPAAWVFVLAPSGLLAVPKSAVPIEERARVSADLRAWAGAKYKVRER